MKHRKRIRAYDGETVDLRIRDPFVTVEEAPTARQARTTDDPDGLSYGRAIIRVFDLGTFAAKAFFRGVRYDNFIEIPMEGSPNPTPGQRIANLEVLLQAHEQPSFTLESGESVKSPYPLQVDEETAAANVAIELRGRRGARIRGLSIGSDVWLGREEAVDQRESIARLRGSAIPQARNEGFDGWEEALDRRDRRRWGSNVAHKVDREGEFRMRTAPQALDMIFRSQWQYEHFQLGDRQRYLCTHGRQILDRPLDPPPSIRLSGRSVRLDVYAAPQLHDVRFEWIDLYLLTVGWWLTVIALPNIRLITLRSAQFPHTFIAAGIPEQDVLVGETMSARIARTNAFASAIRARQFSPIFKHIGSVQGRYGVYQRSFDANVLCAILEFHWPLRTPEVVRVFRKRQIVRPRTLLEMGGLYVPGLVDPWIAGYIVPGQSGGAGDITDGYL